ncbi:hypothetical protein [Paenibacillus hubeiensis]|uniref:hypothetical protein n=1 Tax=Paenibacillus hubeiensis TaxID=3077330 RepID=UPI0031BA4B1C
MTELIIEKLRKIANLLNEDPLSLTFAEISQNVTEYSKDSSKELETYYTILNEYEVLNGGVITVFGHNKVKTLQFYVEEMVDYEGDWFCIGKIESYPLFINKLNSFVSCLYGDPLDQNYVLETYGDFNNFINYYFMGEGYSKLGVSFVENGGSKSTLGSKDDDWYRFLEENNLL